MKWILQFFIVSFIAGSLTACVPKSAVQPADDSALQQAYVVKDQIILAKKSLNDLYAQEKARRISKPASKPFISDATYDSAWKIAQEATDIINQAIAIAHAPAPGTPPGTAGKNLIEDAQKKVDVVNAVAKPPTQ